MTIRRFALFLILVLVAVWWTTGTVGGVRLRQTAPGAPIIGTATAISRATVNFTPPTSDGGSPITLYTATSSPGAFTATCKWSPCYVEGLALSTNYTFTVRATNAIGQGAASAASNSVQVSTALVPPLYMTDWTNAGVDIPTNRTTPCATLTAATYGNGTTSASADLQAAVDKCPDDQVVVMGAGVFTIDTLIQMRSHKLVRGQGPGVTILQKRNGVKVPPNPGVQPVAQDYVYEPIFQFGPSRYPGSPPAANVANITSNAVKGASTVTVLNASSLFAADQIVLIDQDDYTNSTWQYGEPQLDPDPRHLQLMTDKLFIPIKCFPFTDNVGPDYYNKPSVSAPDGIIDCTEGTGPTTAIFPNLGGIHHSIPVPTQLGAFSRPGRWTAEMKEIASVSGNTITFKTPFHTDFTVAMGGQIAWWTPGANTTHTRLSGIEDMTLANGTSGNVFFTNAAYSWVKNVDMTQQRRLVNLISSYKIEIRDSIIRDHQNPVPGGGGYLISIQDGTSEVLIENNVLIFGEKPIVARSAGGGSVLGYNYVDDAYIGYSPTFPEFGINSSHNVGSHSVLFEGNYAQNYDQDDTWGSAIYNVVLRNHISGRRLSFTDAGGVVRAVGSTRGSYWTAILGNVLGLSGMDADWIFEDPVDNTYGGSWMWGLPFGKKGTIYRIGYGTANPANTMRADPKVRSTFIREGNYDYVTLTRKWDRASGSFTIPTTYYLPGKPPFFTAGQTWPWVDAGGATKVYALPAKIRHDAMVAAATVPSAPVINIARVDTATTAMVHFFPPVSNGGRVITGYTATATPGDIEGVNSSWSVDPDAIYVTGLSPGVSYTFKVKATNSVGTGAESAASNAVLMTGDPVPEPPGNIVRVQTSTGATRMSGSTVTASLTAPLTTPVTAGNLIVVLVRGSGTTSGISSISDTLGNTYTLHASGTSGSYPRLWLYSAVSIAAGDNTVTCSFTPSGSWEWCEAIEYAPGSGNTWSPVPTVRLNTSGSSQGAGVTDIVSTAITSTAGGVLVLAATQSQASSSVYTAGTDFTLVDNLLASAINYGGVEDFITTTPLAAYVAHITGTQTTNFRNIWGLFRTSTGGASIPGAPGIGTATAGNTSATVTFTAPGSNGGSPITAYTATSAPGGFTGTTTTVQPIVLAGLANGTAYTFTVTATNDVGTGPASAASNSVTPAPVVPGAPTIGTATAGNAQATVTFTAPTSNGGAAITGYTATSSPGGLTATGAGSPLTVTGLSNGNAYTFTVRATNSVGTGAASAASNSVTPVAPSTVPSPPLIGTATAGNAQASVTFTPGATGGSAITGFTVTSAPGGLTGTGASSPIVVTGLTNGTPYSFTVTATNAIGISNPSASSNQVTPATVPTAPTIGTATAGTTTATVAFTPGADGGSPVTVYTATSSPGAISATGGSSPIAIGGLSFGVSYTFTVTATNALGVSASSAASNSVTLSAPTEERTVSADQFHLAQASGCFIRSGTGAPASNIGSICDQYFRIDSPYTVYRKTDANTWAAISTGSGGTAPYVQGDILTADSATTLGRVAPAAFGSVLRSNGVGVVPSWTNSPSLTAIGGAANLTLSPAGDVIMGAAGNDFLPSVPYTKNIGALTNKFLTLHAAELWVETLVAQNTIATIGGRVMVGPTTILEADLTATPPGLFITVKHNQIANGDILYLEANGQVEFLRVTSAATGTGPYTYSVVRNLDTSSVNAWPAGTAVFNTGTTGDGYIDLYSISAVNGPAVFGPTIAGRVRTSDTVYSAMEPRWAIGNLNGQFGYGQDIYGAAFGDGKSTPTGPWMKIDANTAAQGGGGIRAGNGANTYLTIDPTGNAWFSGNLTVGTGGRNMLANSEFMRGRAMGDRGSHAWGGMASQANPDVNFTCPSPCLTNFNRDGMTGFDSDSGLAWNIGTNYSPDWQPVSGGALYWSPFGIPSAGNYSRVWGPQLPVQHGSWYEFSFYAGVHRGDALTAHFIWLNAAGTIIGETDGTYSQSCDGTTGLGGRNLAGWCRVWGLARAPTSGDETLQAHTVIPTMMQTYGTGATQEPYTFVTRVYFGTAQEGQTRPSPWGPAGTTLITGSMLATDLVMTSTIHSPGVSSLTTGTGFWMDALAATPTFRVGNPAGNRLAWDGTNLTIGQGSLTIGATGIQILPGTSSTYSSATAYGYTVPSGTLGTFGWDSAGVARNIQMIANWTGAGTRAVSSNLAANFAGIGFTPAASSVAAEASSNVGTVTVSTSQNSVLGAGRMILYAYPDFQNDAATNAAVGGSATAPPGQPCGYLIAIYQQDIAHPIRIPFYANNGNTCPTVP